MFKALEFYCAHLSLNVTRKKYPVRAEKCECRPAVFPNLGFSPALTETPQKGGWFNLKMPRLWPQARSCELETPEQSPTASLQGDLSTYTALLASGVRELIGCAETYSACERPGVSS